MTNFVDNFFDAIIAISTIQHVGIFEGDEEGDKKAIADMRRILKPNGVCILTVPFARERSKFSMRQRVYDSLSLEELLVGFRVGTFLVYHRNEDGVWEGIDPGKTPKFENIVNCVALIECTKLDDKWLETGSHYVVGGV